MYTKQCTQNNKQKMYTKHVFKTCIENLNTKQCIQNKSISKTTQCIQYNVCIQNNV